MRLLVLSTLEPPAETRAGDGVEAILDDTKRRMGAAGACSTTPLVNVVVNVVLLHSRTRCNSMTRSKLCMMLTFDRHATH